MEQLTSNVFVESKFYPTVSFVVTSEGIVAIDTPMDPHSAAEWRRFVESKGELRYIINTEFHADYIMGNAFFPGIIVTSEYNREHFLDSVKSNENVRKMFLQFFPNSGDIVKSYNLRWPDITFRQRVSLCLGGTEFLILCSPGHTLGQTIVHVPGERVLMAADNIVYGAPPFSCCRLAVLVRLPGHARVFGRGMVCPGSRYTLQKRLDSSFT